MSEEQNKLNIIDKLLSRESNLEEYIETMESQNTDVPENLSKKIGNNIKLVDSIRENKSKFNFAFIDCLKVACFSLVTVLSWELVVSKINNIDYSKLHKETRIVSYSNQNNSITNKLSEFMLDEIIKGGNEK